MRAIRPAAGQAARNHQAAGAHLGGRRRSNAPVQNYGDHAAEMAARAAAPEPDPHTLGLKPLALSQAGRSTLAAPTIR